MLRTRLVAVVLAAATVLLLPAAAHAWTWPSGGAVLRPFSVGSDPYAGGEHRGIDVAGDLASTVRAPAGGRVTFAGSVPASGLVVSIETPEGYTVTLTHLGSISASIARGAVLVEGVAVGTIGATDAPEVDRPYVHLGVRVTTDE